jgi:hypothetical protein
MAQTPGTTICSLSQGGTTFALPTSPKDLELTAVSSPQNIHIPELSSVPLT